MGLVRIWRRRGPKSGPFPRKKAEKGGVGGPLIIRQIGAREHICRAFMRVICEKVQTPPGGGPPPPPPAGLRQIGAEGRRRGAAAQRRRKNKKKYIIFYFLDAERIMKYLITNIRTTVKNIWGQM